ncbi:MAG: hypothetical protein R3A52_05295 [Polyangiales bacterium]
MDDELSRLRDERERLFKRITWWEAHRTNVLIPVTLAAFGLGLGLGVLLQEAVGLPRQWGFLFAVAFLFIGSRLLDRAFRTTRLDAIDARIASLQRKQRRAP